MKIFADLAVRCRLGWDSIKTPNEWFWMKNFAEEIARKMRKMVEELLVDNGEIGEEEGHHKEFVLKDIIFSQNQFYYRDGLRDYLSQITGGGRQRMERAISICKRENFHALDHWILDVLIPPKELKHPSSSRKTG